MVDGQFPDSAGMPGKEDMRSAVFTEWSFVNHSVEIELDSGGYLEYDDVWH